MKLPSRPRRGATAGVKIGHGSDLEGILHPTSRANSALKAQVMSPWEVIVAATATNAELMGQKGRLGIVAPGALADLVVVDGDPLTNLDLLGGQGERLPLILKGGEVVKNAL